MMPTTTEPRTVLIATLGGQPQVVTFALDALLAQGQHFDEVVVISLAAPRYRAAFRRLAEAFPGDQYAGRSCHFRGVVVQTRQLPLTDVTSTADADAVWRTVHDLVGTLKADGVRLHLLLTGGRRLLALLAVSAALLHLEHGDRVWHMFMPDAVQQRAKDEALLHVDPVDSVQLIEVPLAPLGAYFPGIRSLLSASPAQVLAAQTQWLDGVERARCQTVIAQLTGRQIETLQAFADGLTPQQVAEQMGITLGTVDAHKTVILDHCRNAWELPEGMRLGYHFLREKFGRYFAGLAPG